MKIEGKPKKAKRKAEYEQLLAVREEERQAELAKIPPEPEMTPEEKAKRLEEGLYGSW